jgi:hypothetical protein
MYRVDSYSSLARIPKGVSTGLVKKPSGTREFSCAIKLVHKIKLRIIVFLIL